MVEAYPTRPDSIFERSINCLEGFDIALCQKGQLFIFISSLAREQNLLKAGPSNEAAGR